MKADIFLHFAWLPAPVMATGELAAAAVAGQAAALFGLVVLNGFFVASEYAIEKLRGADIDMEGEGVRLERLKLARHIAANPEKFLAATRMGITVTTMLLGLLAHLFLGALLEDGARRAGLVAPDGVVATAATAIAFLLVLSVLVVIGELVPKSVGIRNPLPTVMGCGRVLGWFRRLLYPVRRPLEAVSSWILRHMLRVEPVREGEIVHNSEQLQAIVEETGDKSDVTETEREIVLNALELSDMIVRDIMIPRHEVVCLDVAQSFEENLRLAIESRHTRLPLIRGHMDNTLGLIHIKDLLRQVGQKDAGLEGIRRELLPVPEQMPLDRLLDFFLREHAQLALVVDEFGGALGVVFLDNVIEQLVGDIHDEFDEQDQEFHRLNDDEFFAEGSLGLHELADHTDLELENDDVSTIGGLVTQRIGHVPRSGESLEIDGYLATVTKTDGRRVVQIHFKRLVPGGGSRGAEED